MGAVINTNISSLNAQRNLNTSQTALSTSLQRLSSGLRINSAKDDAAGLAISERFTSQIRGLDQAKRNSNDGISLLQTAEGSLQSTGDILQRVRELAVQSANATNSAGDRKAIQAEVGQLLSESDRISQTSEFNGLKLLDGSFGSAQFQVGANSGQTITATTANFRTNNYGNNEQRSNGVDAAAGAAYVPGTFDIQGLATQTISVSAADTAKTVASTVNSFSAITGVTAEAETKTQLSFTAGESYSLALTSDNSTAANVSFAVTANTSSGLASAVSSINDVSSKTGVTAKLNDTSDGIVLTNATGNNIRVDNTSTSVSAPTLNVQSIDAGGALRGGAATVAVGTEATSIGYVKFNSDKGYAIGGTISATDFTAGAATLNSISDIDVSTVAGAQAALKTLDAGLASVNGQRATFGALQSRFESAVVSVQTTSENLSASRSRIQDTDFASETAKLTRGQILQQAGTAMLAQANSLPNGVLSLLRG